MDGIGEAADRLIAGKGATLSLTTFDKPVRIVPSRIFGDAEPVALYVFAPGRPPFEIDAFKPVTPVRLIARLYRPAQAAELAQSLNLLLETVICTMTNHRREIAVSERLRSCIKGLEALSESIT